MYTSLFTYIHVSFDTFGAPERGIGVLHMYNLMCTRLYSHVYLTFYIHIRLF